jgi:hypothetical protein
VNPFYISPSFEYYYKGTAPSSLVPVVAAGETFVAVEVIAAAEPMQKTFEAIESTLRGGHRVWVAGILSFPPEGQNPPRLPPAPNSPYGWASSPYVYTWTLQLAHFLRAQGGQISGLRVAVDQPVNRYERYELYVVDGWKQP